MKYEMLVYALVSTVIITGALMKILHLPYANAILLVGFVGGMLVQSWHVTQFEEANKRVRK